MDKSEFEGVYRAYFSDVYFYILKISGSEVIAEDITSETFLKAMEVVDSFRGDCEIRVWLCKIAKNCYYSYLRKHKNTVPFDEKTEKSDFLSIEQNFIDKDASMKIYSLLHVLSEPYKEVFMLRTLGELSFRDIGELFGKSENWACVTYHRAKAKIISEMEDYK